MTINHRQTVSRDFREGIKNVFPGLEETIEFWMLMSHLIFGRRCEYSDCPIVDSSHLANAEGKLHMLKTSKRYIGKVFLHRFQKEVMSPETFTWSGWNYQEGRARVARVIFPEEINALIEKELTNTSEDRVYFISGLKIRPSLLKAQRDAIKKEASSQEELAIPEVVSLLKYMNNLPVHAFSKVINKNWDAAWFVVNQIQEPSKFRAQVEIMMTIRENLQPFYKPSEKQHTDRIFPCNYSIPMLRREVRKVLTKGWYEFDLCNSQLAIVAKLWDIPLVQEFLKSNSSIWPSLFAHYGFNQQALKLTNESKHNTIKEVLKTSLYSLIYGMSKRGLMYEINEGLKTYNLIKPGSHFFTHPLIKTIYEAREIKYKELNDIGEGQTIFGTTRKVYGSKTSKGTPSKERMEYIASILAHQAQSLELYILLPVIDLAKTTKDFYITLWQHDGFSLHFNDKSKVDYWIKKIQSVVQQKIDEQEILTHLEWELL